LSMRTSSLGDLERKSLTAVFTDSSEVKSHSTTETGVFGDVVLS
jgi:hypothetical protein